MATFEFRDGKREIPDYLADVLREYESKTYQITYEEAMDLANRKMERDVIEKRMNAVINQHFKVNF